MSVRGIAMPLVDGRGAGLGNEMIVWGKAFIAAQMLGLSVTHPAWGLNQRGYSRYFGTSRADWLVHRALCRTLPFHRFDDAARQRHGGTFGPALAAFAVEHGLTQGGRYVLGLHGMGGGFGQLEPARDFLRSQLLATRGTLANLYAIDRRTEGRPLRIGLHVRRGDFGALDPQQSYRGRFNVILPLDWYVAVATSLHRALGDKASFVVVSDAADADLLPLTRALPCELTSDRPDRDVSDMLTLAACDFLVCSISSYSLWAAFLSDGRYGWYAPNLTPHGDMGSIWGHEAEQQAPGSATQRALTDVAARRAAGDVIAARGVAIGADGVVPDAVIADLERRAALRRPSTDLLHYGVTPLEPDA